jgi:CRP-like cAMP-binding protein
MDTSNQFYRNRLLQLLSPIDFDRLRPHLEPVALGYRDSLYETNEEIAHVYFPIEGVASLVNTMADGSATEVGTIGNEGIVGLPVILGDHHAPCSAYVQVPGSGLRLRADVLRKQLELSTGTRTVMLHYAHAFFNQVAQSAACVHFHSIGQRCCRWLLMTHDRVRSDRFLLTQEFLGMMLGVQRTGVSNVAARLKQLKLIGYSRGNVTILDRPGLEKHTCECYFVTKHEFDRLLGPVSAEQIYLSGDVRV